MSRFPIVSIVNEHGETIEISGITSVSYGLYDDPTNTYTKYSVSGVVQVMDGSEEEVTEGILNKEDVVMFIDDSETNSDQLKNDNYILLSGNAVGTYRIVNSIHNPDHYEVHAKRILKG